jgi:hypothetical protein
MVLVLTILFVVCHHPLFICTGNCIFLENLCLSHRRGASNRPINLLIKIHRIS